ncbi:MAG: sulfatase [Pirellulales bacterium]
MPSMTVALGGGQRSNHEPPNVLLIAIDDMNDWIGCLHGHSGGYSPNIDRLAKRGTLFANAHCQAPICNPSRTSIMYGLRPSGTGVYMNSPKPWSIPAMSTCITLPRWFAKHGYHTMTAGKIYHGSGLPTGDFDHVGPRPGQRFKTDTRIRKDLPKGVAGLWDFGPQHYEDSKFPDHIDATWAIEQLEKEHAKPFFLAVGFYRPHVPWYAPDRIFKDFPLDEIALPPVKDNDRDDIPPVAFEVSHVSSPPPHAWFVEHNAWKPAIQSYLSCIQWTDEQVGRLVAALDQSEYAQNTIVVLYSDHGFHLGEKQRWVKFSLWERSTHVPFILYVPGRFGGTTVQKPTELLSIYPTLVELCGLPPNDAVEGRSLIPLLEKPDSDWPYPALTTHGYKNHALRSERYRYIRYYDGSEELYDMQTDPNEWENLASEHRLPRHQAIIDQFTPYLPTQNHAQQHGGARKRK